MERKANRGYLLSASEIVDWKLSWTRKSGILNLLLRLVTRKSASANDDLCRDRVARLTESKSSQDGRSVNRNVWECLERPNVLRLFFRPLHRDRRPSALTPP